MGGYGGVGVWVWVCIIVSVYVCVYVLCVCECVCGCMFDMECISDMFPVYVALLIQHHARIYICRPL